MLFDQWSGTRLVCNKAPSVAHGSFLCLLYVAMPLTRQVAATHDELSLRYLFKAQPWPPNTAAAAAAVRDHHRDRSTTLITDSSSPKTLYRRRRADSGGSLSARKVTNTGTTESRNGSFDSTLHEECAFERRIRQFGCKFARAGEAEELALAWSHVRTRTCLRFAVQNLTPPLLRQTCDT